MVPHGPIVTWVQPSIQNFLSVEAIAYSTPEISPPPQAILFYVPRWLWKNWEAGKISALKMDLDQGIITESEKRQKKKLLIDYLYSNLKNHNFWAYRYFFCEFLGILNVVGEQEGGGG